VQSNSRQSAQEDIMSNLTRYDPLDDLFRGFFVRPVDFGQMPEAPSVKIDVKEQEKAYTVHAELPGIKKEDIHVTIDGSTVSISAERKQEKEVKDEKDPAKVLRTERYFGKVSRTFQLGQDVDDAKASAKFADGVLELTLPKKVAAKTKRLVID
jgi:HSP20 family protein